MGVQEEALRLRPLQELRVPDHGDAIEEVYQCEIRLKEASVFLLYLFLFVFIFVLYLCTMARGQ